MGNTMRAAAPPTAANAAAAMNAGTFPPPKRASQGPLATDTTTWKGQVAGSVPTRASGKEKREEKRRALTWQMIARRVRGGEVLPGAAPPLG